MVDKYHRPVIFPDIAEDARLKTDHLVGPQERAEQVRDEYEPGLGKAGFDFLFRGGRRGGGIAFKFRFA
ncbi:hypothetical protein AncyloWKF20_19890 [Ancylobacter sp. WKF20]|uniref:hypothetical protein n=1 Tax=Ancylobacter sp. WKF20 TaxID=3039801 RepID=UPI0024341C7C|nr:hypothetical protein [Ancylobacter sp. WKF20]WGD29982.1 hypothetical protein AncyloWKF20_19890 [Ancylobacter sp. WKF20]